MRYLIIFMLLVGVFVVGRRWSPFTAFGVRGEGPVVTEPRSVSDFHAVNSSISADVTVRTGEQPGVMVYAQQNLLPLLKTEVNNEGVLRIYFDGSVSYDGDVRIEVTTRSIDALMLSGSGEIKMLTRLLAENANLKLSGSGDIIVPDAQVNTADVEISGSGSIRMGGSAQTLRAGINGSGDILAENLRTETLDADVTGSGSVHADVVRSITGRIAGSGDVHYTGDPTTNVKITGSGSVNREGASAAPARDTTADGQ